MTLQEIKSTISEPLSKMEEQYRRTLYSPVPLLNEINDYLLARSGKQIRPLLVILSAYAGIGELDENTMQEKINLAIAMEMLHNSSLMHDDVVDESELRRGRETVRQHWSNKIAVLSGDYYLARVMQILNEIGDSNISQIVNSTVIEMSEGELLQQQVSRNMDQNEANYYSVIYKKTASLMKACCQIGYDGLKTFGEHFGMAFQIRDDIMDYHTDKETGKPQGNDIRERKMTLPLLCYLKKASEEEAEKVLALLKKDTLTDQEADEVVAKVTASGALDDAHIILENKLEEARTELMQLPDSKYKMALNHLIDLMR